jgi:hypothetical protein
MESFGFQSCVYDIGEALRDVTPALKLVEETERRLEAQQAESATLKNHVATRQASEGALQERIREDQGERLKLLSELAGKDSQIAELFSALAAKQG